MKLRLPPVISHPKIAKLADSYVRHQGEHRQLQEDRYGLEQTREQARELDVHAAAEAHRAGKADPGQANVEAHDAKLAEAQRREAVLAEVVKRDAAELLDAIDDLGDAWREQIERRTTDARAAVGAALDQLAAATVELQGSLAVGAWLSRVQAGYPETAHYAPAAFGSLPPNRHSNGEPRRVDEIVNELRVLADGPKPALRKVAA